MPLFKKLSGLFGIAILASQPLFSNNPPVYQAQAGRQQIAQDKQIQQESPIFGNQKQVSSSNPFLEYYTRKDTPILNNNEAFLFQAGGKTLVKKTMDKANLKKAVIIFFGDWCPHCKNFLASFAHNIDLLRLSGISIIFVAIPSIEKLQHWKEPNIDDFNTAENKISSFGIKLVHDRVFVTMIGERSILSTCGIEGLPVAVVVQNGIEKFRATGENAIEKLNFANQQTFKNFLEIFESDNSIDKIDKKEKESVEIIKKEGKKSLSQKKKYKAKKTTIEKYTFSKKTKTSFKKKVDREKTNKYTEMLNFYVGDLNR